MHRSAAEGYQQNSLSEQKVDGEDFIQTDVCPKVGDVILDLGCGTGELSAYLAELVGPEGKVIGVDPDKERIQLAKETHNQIENLSFVEGSAINFPGIGANVYNIVFSNYMFFIGWVTSNKSSTTCVKVLRVDVSKYRPEVYNSEKSKILKKNSQSSTR